MRETSLFTTSTSEQRNDRELGGSQDGSGEEWESYLVDRKGNEYEPYALAWRYLGMYIDCDINNGSCDNDDDDDGGSGDDNEATRKVLWAAYVDPRYKGGSIGEYQFYDWTTDTWDTSTCKTKRCAKMDCHVVDHSHYKLVGVFKETDGLTDWAEQLFKHEGYCVWNDDDTYSFMEQYRQNWVSSCVQLNLPDDYGNTLYLNTQPQPEGNMTYGIYLDEDCLEVSPYSNFADYVVSYYTYYYGNSDTGYTQAAQWNSTFDMWNEYMNTYKVCQPCRAYSLNINDGDGNSGDGNSGDGDRRRFLDGDENDGEGEEEQWGYNCYDDAGYTNCNQCYKFETHTDMEVATVRDLERASSQGSLLQIRYKGKLYGSGGFGATSGGFYLGSTTTQIFLGISFLLLLGIVGYLVVRKRHLLQNAWEQIKWQYFKLTKGRGSLAMPSTFRESFSVNHNDETTASTKGLDTTNNNNNDTDTDGSSSDEDEDDDDDNTDKPSTWNMVKGQLLQWTSKTPAVAPPTWKDTFEEKEREPAPTPTKKRSGLVERIKSAVSKEEDKDAMVADEQQPATMKSGGLVGMIKSAVSKEDDEEPKKSKSIDNNNDDDDVKSTTENKSVTSNTSSSIISQWSESAREALKSSSTTTTKTQQEEGKK